MTLTSVGKTLNNNADDSASALEILKPYVAITYDFATSGARSCRGSWARFMELTFLPCAQLDDPPLLLVVREFLLALFQAECVAQGHPRL